MLRRCPPGVTWACDGETAVRCDEDGNVLDRTDCASSGLRCVPDRGCAVCAPGEGSCSGNVVQRCNADGTGWEMVAQCSPAQSCDPASLRCVDACARARESNSYIGCEYWAVPLSNSQLAPEFEFAVVVANPQAVPANVQVLQGGRAVASATVAPGALETIRLPWVPSLKGEFPDEASVLATRSAYLVRSDQPVTVYQFNPLEYRIPRDCAEEPPGGEFDRQCFSYSNDASLLLPVHVLRQDYIVAARPTMMLRREAGFEAQTLTSPSMMAVVGAAEAPVDVQIRFTAHTLASRDGSVRAFRPGETGLFRLGPGDVLQILAAAPPSCPSGAPTDSQGGVINRYCPVGQDYDLTGTRITASGPVAVFGGHNCAFVPFHRWACDHLEEQLFPLEAWGRRFVVSITEPLRGEPNVVRVVSGADGNRITFQPASVHEPVTLDAGQYVEFEARAHFVVEGTGALLVAQFLVGQDYAGIGSSGFMAEGDPSMALAIPDEQYRTDYAFLAPTSFQSSFVNVVARMGQRVVLDGTEVGGWQPVGSTGWAVARVRISSGAHAIRSSEPFGIVVYGFGNYTSYMYPGGLDLRIINPLR